MKDQELDDFLKEWEATWERPGAKKHLRQLGQITLLVILLLGMVYGCDRLKKMDQSDRNIEAQF